MTSPDGVSSDREGLVRELRAQAEWPSHDPSSLLVRAADALESALRDSQRLDWMEQSGGWAVEGAAGWAVRSAGVPYRPVSEAASLRAAIDGAMTDAASSTHPLGGDDR
jgi:hypothetical protein